MNKLFQLDGPTTPFLECAVCVKDVMMKIAKFMVTIEKERGKRGRGKGEEGEGVKGENWEGRRRYWRAGENEKEGT